MRQKKIRGFLLAFAFLISMTCCGKITDQTADEKNNAAGAAVSKEDAAESEQETIAAPDAEPEEPGEEPEEPKNSFDITLTFAGDICLDDSWAVMQHYVEQQEQLEECISAELIDIMKQADIAWINNEFSYSLRGAPLANKAYTFRADPERVEILKEMGIDIVGLANNHVYDYGQEAMLDTLDTLENAGIPYVGAGRNLEEASSPVYMEVSGKKVAFVAASRAEKFKMTPQAAEDAPGILRCYNTELFLEEIKEARENADYVIALVHWGTEYSTELEKVQTETGREYIDAGADIVVGAHTHCLQGMEYYNGKPIIYSLGNFWFNNKPLDTMLLQVHIFGDDADSALEVQVIPAKQENCQTRMLHGDDAEKLYRYLEGLSEGLTIDENGMLHEDVREDISGLEEDLEEQSTADAGSAAMQRTVSGVRGSIGADQVIISLTGDCSLGKLSVHGYDGTFYEMYDKYGASYFFQNVKDIFASDDMTLANFEGVLTDSDQTVEKEYNIKGKPEFNKILPEADIEAVSFGNNHRIDYGEQGIEDTIAALDEVGVIWAYDEITGIYETKKGIRVGFVSVNEVYDGEEVEEYLKAGIQKLKKEDVDIVIACCHWGEEMKHYIEDYQGELGHKCIDWGADLVVGNHPHVLQGIENYKNKYILYSLGNFCFGGNMNPKNKDSMIVQASFPIKDGKINGEASLKVIPCTISSTERINDYRPTVAGERRSRDIIQKMNEYSKPFHVMISEDGSVSYEF